MDEAGDRRQGRRAARSAAEEDRRAAPASTICAPLVAELHTIGVNAFFSSAREADFKDASVEMAIADQGGLGLPDRDYYFQDDAKSVELRKQYVEHVGKMLGARSARRRTQAARRGAAR